MELDVKESAFSGLGKVTGKRRWKARLVGVGPGSSAVYTEEALQSSFAQAFPAGTRVNINHQSFSENMERNLEQLAGALCTDPVFEGDGMYAEVEFSEKWAPFIEEFSEIIGLSISGVCTAKENRTGEGDYGELPEVDRFVYSPLNTVDVVTAPGANGRFIEALESYRATIKPVRENATNNRPFERGFVLNSEDIASISEAVAKAVKQILDDKDLEKAKKAKEEEDEKKKKEEKKAKESFAAAVNLIAESELPAVSRKRVSEAFVAGGDVRELIKEEIELVESIRSGEGVRPADKGGVDYAAEFAKFEW